ncbi:unnamed protein product, partial [Rotaria sp. Silwood2]
MIKETLIPSRHLNLVEDLNNIGLMLAHLEKYENALKYHQKALRIQDKHYLHGYVTVAVTRNYIGLVLCQQDDIEEAIQLSTTVLGMRKKYYPLDHKKTYLIVFIVLQRFF